MDETISRQPTAVNPELVWDYDIPRRAKLGERLYEIDMIFKEMPNANHNS